jgi:hypothetical protein
MELWGMDPPREYAAALATCPSDRLVAAHHRAVAGLSATDREVLLHAVRDRLLTGTRTAADDIAALARFVACAELRRPGLLLDALPATLAETLRRYVVIALPLVGPSVRPRDRTTVGPAPDPSHDSGWEQLLQHPPDAYSLYAGVAGPPSARYAGRRGA